jgi:hypothetical protein
MIPQDGTLVGVAVLGVIFTTCRHDGIIILWRGFSNRSPLGGGHSATEQSQAASTDFDHARHHAPHRAAPGPTCPSAQEATDRRDGTEPLRRV